MTFQKPKGTEDFLPEEMAQRNAIFSILRNTAVRFCFQEVSTPAIESLSLLTKKEGEEIKQQIFTLEKRSTEEFGLRFDLTVPITRLFVEQQKSLQKPVKWFSIDRMWRYEQPQKGRLREFYQLSAELFGSDSLYADAQIISFALECLEAFGLSEKDILLRLNSRKLLEALLIDFIPETKISDVIRLIDKKSKVAENEFSKELGSLGIDAQKVIALLDTPFPSLSSSRKEAADCILEMRKLLSLLERYKNYIQVDLSTARGLAYYTGIVFEVFDRQGKFRAILGGGRYDNLVELFGGQKTPATGFALGYATLSLLLKEKGMLPKSTNGVDYYIAPLSDAQYPVALKVASFYRRNHSVEIDIMGRNLGNQFKYASRIPAKKVVIIGDDEIKGKAVTVRDMESGKEQKIPLSDIL